MPKLNAAQLEAQYGDELRRLHAGAPTARRMHNALLERQPPLDVPDGVLKVWIEKYGTSAGTTGVPSSSGAAEASAVSTGSAASAGPAPKRGQSASAPADPPVSAPKRARGAAASALGGLAAGQKYLNAKELEAQYGDELRQEPYASIPGARALLNKLLERTPPLYATDQSLKTWIDKYRDVSASVTVDSAEALEATYGGKIREFKLEQRKSDYLLMNNVLKTFQPRVIVSKPVAARCLQQRMYRRGRWN